MNRRRFMTAMGMAVMASQNLIADPATEQLPRIKRKGRIKQGLWKITFGEDRFSFEEMCRHAERLGAYGMDLIPAKEWPTLRKYKLEPLMAAEGPVDFSNGIINTEVNIKNEDLMHDYIDHCADNGVKLFVTIGGLRKDLPFDQAADNAVTFLNRIRDHLEQREITIALENMNTRRATPGFGRPGQIFGHWDWGVDVCRRVDSPKVKLLCDIYHLQVMDGDLVTRIRESIEWIGHFHVAGVPAKNEIGPDQEVNYRYLAEMIAGLDYQGYVSHEWRPSPGRDPLKAIEQAMAIMDV